MATRNNTFSKELKQNLTLKISKKLKKYAKQLKKIEKNIETHIEEDNASSLENNFKRQDVLTEKIKKKTLKLKKKLAEKAERSVVNTGSHRLNTSKPNTIDYKETQDKLLCGKHAFNHILQENKLEWFPKMPNYYNTRTKKFLDEKEADPMDPAIQINMFYECDKYKTHFKETIRQGWFAEEIARIRKSLESERPTNPYDQKGWNNTQRIYKNKTDNNIRKKLEPLFTNNEHDPEFFCSNKNGNFPADMFDSIIRRLGFTYDKVSMVLNNSQDLSWIEPFQRNIDKPNLLGVLINIPGHYVAIPKYVNNSKKNHYIFADSAGDTIFTSMHIDELIPYLIDLKPRAMFFIYADEGSYKSVAVQRMLRGP